MMRTAKQENPAVMLFESESLKPVLPKPETSLLEDLYDEIELIAFPISDSMFSIAKSDYRGDVLAKDLRQYEGKVVRMIGDFVCDKPVHTRNGKYMKFGTFLDIEGNSFDTVHFPPSLKSYPLNGNGVYLVQGKVVLDFGYPAIEVQEVRRMPLKPATRSI